MAAVYPSLHNWLTGCLDYCTETNQIRVRNFAAPEPALMQLQQELDALNYGIVYIDAPLMHRHLQTYQDLASVLERVYSARSWLNLNMHELSQLYRQRQLQPQHLVTLQNWCSQAQIPNFGAYAYQGQQLLTGKRASHWRIPELITDQLQLVTQLQLDNDNTAGAATTVTTEASATATQVTEPTTARTSFTTAASSFTQEPTTATTTATSTATPNSTTPDIFSGLIQQGNQVQLNSMPYVSRGYLRYPAQSPAQIFNLNNELLAGTLEELNILSHRLLTAPVVSNSEQADPVLALHQPVELSGDELLENQALMLQAYDILNQISPQGYTPSLDREQITQQYQALQQRRALGIAHDATLTISAADRANSDPVENLGDASSSNSSDNDLAPSSATENTEGIIRCYPRAPWEQHPNHLQYSYLNWTNQIGLVQADQAPWASTTNQSSEASLAQLEHYTPFSSDSNTTASTATTAPASPDDTAYTSRVSSSATTPKIVSSNSSEGKTFPKECPFRAGPELGIVYDVERGTTNTSAIDTATTATTFTQVRATSGSLATLGRKLTSSSTATLTYCTTSALLAELLLGKHVHAATTSHLRKFITQPTRDLSSESGVFQAPQLWQLASRAATAVPTPPYHTSPSHTPRPKVSNYAPRLVNGFGNLVVGGAISNSPLLPATNQAQLTTAQRASSASDEQNIQGNANLASQQTAAANATGASANPVPAPQGIQGTQGTELANHANPATADLTATTPLEVPTPSAFLTADYINIDFTSGKFNPTNLGGSLVLQLPDLTLPTWQGQHSSSTSTWTMPWMDESDLEQRALRVLKELFGYGEFRGLQEQVISHILRGEDVLAIMATGAGKSLCYQIPALCQQGCALVVSPLIALMEDQVQQLQERGIPAASITMKNSKDTPAILEQVRNGHLKFLYIAPERAVSDYFLSVINSLPINLIAIDEAHCVINWGHHFRPDYIYLHKIRENMRRQVPVLACTATARRDTRLGILEKLALRKSAVTGEHNVLVGDFNRPNIEINVENLRNIGEKKSCFKKLIKKCEKPAIVYCHGRNTVEAVTKLINDDLELKATMYHAGLNVAQRDKNQRAFTNGDYDIIVATIAFGMGIDKSDIRTIIHYDYPSSLEGYYQEIGRAGRDGAPSRAYLLSDVSSQPFRKRIIVQQATDEQRHQPHLLHSQENPELVQIIKNLSEDQITHAIETGTPLRELARQEYERQQLLRGNKLLHRNASAGELERHASEIDPNASASSDSKSVATSATSSSPTATSKSDQALTLEQLLSTTDLRQCVVDLAELPKLPLYERADLPLELFKLSEELPEQVMELALTLQQTAQQLSKEHFLQLGKQLQTLPQYAPLLEAIPEFSSVLAQTPLRDGLESTLPQLPEHILAQLARLYVRVAELHHATRSLQARVTREYRNGNPWADDVAQTQQGTSQAFKVHSEEAQTVDVQEREALNQPAASSEDQNEVVQIQATETSEVTKTTKATNATPTHQEQASNTEFVLNWTFTPAQLIAYLHAQQVHSRLVSEAQASPFAPQSQSNEEILLYWNLLLRALVITLQQQATQLEAVLANEQLLSESALSKEAIKDLLDRCAEYRLAPLILHPSETELSLEFLQNLRNYITETQFRNFTAGNEALTLSEAVWHLGHSLNLWQVNVASNYLPSLATQVLQHNFAPQVLRNTEGTPLAIAAQVGSAPLAQLPSEPTQARQALTNSGWELRDLSTLVPTSLLTSTKVTELHRAMCQFTTANQQQVTANLLAGWHLASQEQLLTRVTWNPELTSSWIQPRYNEATGTANATHAHLPTGTPATTPATPASNTTRQTQSAPISIQLDPYTSYLTQQAQQLVEQDAHPTQVSEAEVMHDEMEVEQAGANRSWNANSLRSAATIFSNPTYQSQYWSVSPTSCLYLEMAQHLYQEYRVATNQAKQTANIVSQNVQLTPQETMELNLNYLNEVFNYAKSSNCRRKVLLAVFGQELKQDCQHCDTCREKSPSVDLSFDLYYVIIMTTLLHGKGIRPVILNILMGHEARYFVEGSPEAASLEIPFALLKKTHSSIAKIAQRTFRYAPQYWSQVLDYALELGYIAKDNLKGYLNATPAGRDLVNSRQPVRIRTKNSLDKRDIYLETLRNDLNLIFKNLQLRHTLTQQSLEALAKELPTTKEELAQIPGFTTQMLSTRKADAYILKTLQLYRHRLAQRNPLLRASDLK